VRNACACQQGSASVTPRPEPLSLIALTGFLGAGKTTLINAWVKDEAFFDTVVIINEFGEIAIDHQLVETATDDMILFLVINTSAVQWLAAQSGSPSCPLALHVSSHTPFDRQGSVPSLAFSVAEPPRL